MNTQGIIASWLHSNSNTSWISSVYLVIQWTDKISNERSTKFHQSFTVGQSAVLPFHIGIGVDCSSDDLHQIRITSHTFNDSKDRCTLLILTNSPAPAKGFSLLFFVFNLNIFRSQCFPIKVLMIIYLIMHVFTIFISLSFG